MSFETIRIGLLHPWQAHEALQRVWRAIKPLLATGTRFHLEVRAETRTTAQNARLWAMLSAVSEQVEWYGQQLSAEDWKDVFSASLRQERVVPGIEAGRFVLLGQRTSRMTKAELSDLMELIAAFGAERGVVFGDEQREAA